MKAVPGDIHYQWRGTDLVPYVRDCGYATASKFSTAFGAKFLQLHLALAVKNNWFEACLNGIFVLYIAL